MKPELTKWHSIVLQTYNAIMFDTLVHAHNIVTESAKSFQFEDADELELPKPLRGYFAMKDVDGKKTKYFIEDQYYAQLPIRVNAAEEIFFKDNARTRSVVLKPTDITPFRVKALQCWNSNRAFIDEIAPFQHSEPDQWTLSKIVAVMGYVGKTFCGVCSHSEFGKSSIYLILDALTKKCPVFQPRSVPGVLAQITSDGNMVFDEVHDAPGEVKSCMENFSLQVAGNSPIYINGAMKSTNTKPKYDVAQQSITYLYNVYSNYREPEKQFWNFIWSNKKAMESRFLCLKFEGKLLEEFDKDFDIPLVAEQNKMFYIKIAKHLLYLKGLKLTNAYQRRYNQNALIELSGRHKIIYDEIVWGLDMYCESQSEFDKFVHLLNAAINSYQMMISAKTVPIKNFVNVSMPKEQEHSDELVVSEEEVIETPQQRILTAVGKGIMVEELKSKVKIDNFDVLIEQMKSRGDIFFPKPGMVARL